mmetsp:Transcript_95362/g.164545  ORF Transcript_95362/g.164545 Transcript_95362/m.164545 type:complete len:110 (+) Transcript_95362:7056-7385(+)
MEVSSGEFPSQPDISVAHSAMHSAASILQLHDGTHYNPPGDCCAGQIVFQAKSQKAAVSYQYEYEGPVGLNYLVNQDLNLLKKYTAAPACVEYQHVYRLHTGRLKNRRS